MKSMKDNIFSIRPESKMRHSKSWITIILYLAFQAVLVYPIQSKLIENILMIGLLITTLIGCSFILRDFLTTNESLEKPKPTFIKTIIAIVATLACAITVSLLTKSISPQIDYENQNLINNILINGDFLKKTSMILMVIILGPIIEEYVFRYLMIGNSTKIWRPMISCILFVLLHTSIQSNAISYLAICLQYLAIAIPLTVVYKINKNNALASALTHIGYNTIVTIPTIVTMIYGVTKIAN